jgi:hypothetical protein
VGRAGEGHSCSCDNPQKAVNDPIPVTLGHATAAGSKLKRSAESRSGVAALTRQALCGPSGLVPRRLICAVIGCHAASQSRYETLIADSTQPATRRTESEQQESFASELVVCIVWPTRQPSFRQARNRLQETCRNDRQPGTARNVQVRTVDRVMVQTAKQGSFNMVI